MGVETITTVTMCVWVHYTVFAKLHGTPRTHPLGLGAAANGWSVQVPCLGAKKATKGWYLPQEGKLTVFSRPHCLDFFVMAAAATSCDLLSSPTTILSLLSAVHGGTPWPRYS